MTRQGFKKSASCFVQTVTKRNTKFCTETNRCASGGAPTAITRGKGVKPMDSGRELLDWPRGGARPIRSTRQLRRDYTAILLEERSSATELSAAL
ncbi:unnamed protein product [Boreogadus saida]